MSEDKAFEQIACYILNNNLKLNEFMIFMSFTGLVSPTQFVKELVNISIDDESAVLLTKR